MELSREKLIEVLNISCHTPEIKSLKVEQNEDGQNPYSMRPTMHVLLSSPPGLDKTEILQYIESLYKNDSKEKWHPVELVNDISPPGLAGSIDIKTREICHPAAFNCKGGTLLIDEMDLNPIQRGELIRDMLSFTEYERTTRKLGISPKRALIDTENQFECYNGWLKYWGLRCNVILATMKNFRKARDNGDNFFEAMITRFIPLRWTLTIPEIKDMLMHRDKVFHKINYVFPPEILVKYEDYKKIMEVLDQHLEFVTPSNYKRTLNDLIRAFAVTGVHHEDMYKFITLNRNWRIAADLLKEEAEAEEIS